MKKSMLYNEKNSIYNEKNSVNEQNSLENIKIHSELLKDYDWTLRTVDNHAASHPYILKYGFLGE